MEISHWKLYIHHGHTKGSICLYNEENQVMFTGDTIFEKYFGRTDLLTGSMEDMGNSLEYLLNNEKFRNVTIYPGHEEISSIQESKRRIRLFMNFRGIG